MGRRPGRTQQVTGKNDAAGARVTGKQSAPSTGGTRTDKHGQSSIPATDGFYRDLVNSMRNGVLAISRDGRVAVMNETAYHILGLTPRASDVGHPYTGVLRGSSDVVRILAGAFELAHLPNRAELRLKTSGKVIGYTLSQIRDREGVAIGAALFFKDLTRVEQLEERERLRDRLAALGEMAAAIAHEVKNPLAGIEVMAGVLKRQLPDSADAQSILKDIINDVKMANAIVLEVLEFVRPIRLQVEQVSLTQVLRDAITMAESRVNRGTVAVEMDVPADLPSLSGDGHQLRQLFTNLVTNAFEALGGTGSVRITVSHVAADEQTDQAGEPSVAPTVCVEVADNGPGVPAEVCDRIFSPFFTTKIRGSGLGLAIVRKIVDAHDGRIDVDSRAGGGALFRVALPISGARDWATTA